LVLLYSWAKDVKLKNKNIETITIFTRNKKNFILLGTTLGELIILDENTGKILINIKKPYYMPNLENPKINILSNLVYAGSGNDVETVIQHLDELFN